MNHEVEKLFQRQMRAWPQLATGVEGLARAKTRTITIDWFDVFIRHIPHRMGSTTAQVDPESLAKRPCFLCPANLPSEEEGLRFAEDFTIYCNPFPIVDRHLTIVHTEHVAQRIANRFKHMLDLAEALRGYFIIYNGPECGASAPDHMHFQAGSRELFPIERDTAGLIGITVPNYQRNVILLRDRNRAALIRRMDRTLDLLAVKTGKSGEPLINIAVFHERGEWVTYVFPRGKHRPQVFHTRELAVSPAAIDLCGIFVVPRATDFEKLGAGSIAAILREVTLPDSQFNDLAASLESDL